MRVVCLPELLHARICSEQVIRLLSTIDGRDGLNLLVWIKCTAHVTLLEVSQLDFLNLDLILLIRLLCNDLLVVLLRIATTGVMS